MNHENEPLLHPNNQASSKGILPCIPCRYSLAFMTFLGFFCAVSMRVTFNIALVAMVNFTDSANISQVDCPEDPDQINSTITHTNQGKFAWEDFESSLQGAFYYGYIVLQIPGGYLADRVGTKFIFGLAVFISSIITLLLPTIAYVDVTFVIAARALTGLVQGPLFPSNLSMWGKWAPPLERSRLLTLTTAGSAIGNVLASIVTGYLCDTYFLGGWPSPFYLFGGLSFLWSIAWFFFAYDSPIKHPRISRQERDYIERTTHDLDKVPYESPPWRFILTSPAVFAVILWMFCDGFSSYVVLICIPIYLKQLLKFDLTEAGFICAAPSLGNSICSVMSGFLADYLQRWRYLSTAATRKLFTFTGDLFLGVAFLGIAFVQCNSTWAVIFLIGGMFLYGMVGAGAAINHLDIAPRYAGTIMGISNTVGNIGGFLSPLLVGVITKNQANIHLWQKVFYMASGVILSGSIVFVIFGRGKEQPWAVAPNLNIQQDTSSDDDNKEA